MKMKININPIYQLIAQGEHQQQDFKYCINDSRKIARSLVAFANTDGGRLLVGVKDNGKIAGVKSDEEYYMVEAAANIYSEPKINFEVQEWLVEGKTVLEIIVQASSKKPHYAENDQKKWLAYVRRNDENILANRVQLKAWKLERDSKGLLFTYDEPHRMLVQHLRENNEITLSKFSRLAMINRWRAENILAELLRMECILIKPGQQPVVYCLNHDFDFEKLN
ncbi:AlbA family DNA-binding domain-containing protein [Roseimarinus sediminis]|uniref:AlbA family DNA-binding domain-containing protein n=1 Tax=Roseimarinus sediminis TaxID=1610899 RepID=UPI003D248376